MESEKKIELRIGIFTPPIEEQLKDFNIPKEQTDEWEHISNFLFRQSIGGILTSKQSDKLFSALIDEMGFAPTTLCENPDEYACEWKKQLVAEIERLKAENAKLDQARKETAEKILDLLVLDCKLCDENWHSGCLCLRATLAEKIAKQFGVEIKE